MTDDGGVWVKIDGAVVPQGKILQVVQGTTTTTTSTTTATYVDTALTANITPSSATSKVLVLVSVAGVSKSGNNAVGLRINRDGGGITEDFGGQVGYTAPDTAQYTQNSASTSFLDSPAATSALVYKLQMRASAATAYTNRNIAGYINVSTITLMEVSA